MHARSATAAAVAALAGAALLHGLLGARPAPPRPTTVAVVRIQKLFDDLEQRADAKAEVERLESAVREEKARREADLARMRDSLAAATPQKRAELEDAIALEELSYQFWAQEAMNELEVEKALRLQYLYWNIKRSVKEIAESGGYDLVIVDDSIEEAGFDREMRVSPQVQVLQQITSTSVLYVAPRIDITDDLAVRMNNAFKAGGRTTP